MPSSFLPDGTAMSSRACSCTESDSRGLLHEKMEQPKSGTLVSANQTTRYLKGWKEARSFYWVGSVERLQLEPDLELLRHIGDMPGPIVFVMLRPSSQVIWTMTIVHGCLNVCVNQMSGNGRLTGTASAVEKTDN